MHVHGVNPILNVSDFPASIDWFERFGWQKRWDWGDPPTFGAVGADDVEIFLCQGAQGGRDEGGVWMSIWVHDVDEVHAACTAAGIEVTMPPTDEAWGAREMHVRHPDGHVFRVSAALPHDHPHDHPHEHHH